MAKRENSEEPVAEAKVKEVRPKRPRRKVSGDSLLIEVEADSKVGALSKIASPAEDEVSLTTAVVDDAPAAALAPQVTLPSRSEVEDDHAFVGAVNVGVLESSLGAVEFTRDHDVAYGATRDSHAPSQTCLYLTNGYNLVEILTTGLIKTRDGYTKYRPDLLDDSPPNTIPLFCGTVPVNLLPKSRSGAVTRPVAIEIDIPVADCFSTTAIVIVPGPLPLTTIRALHFQNDIDRREVVARNYEGIDFDWYALRTSPEIFIVDDTRAVTASMPDEPTKERTMSYAAVDRLAGAAATLLSIARLSADDRAKALAKSCFALTEVKAPDVSTIDPSWTSEDQEIFEATFPILFRVERNLAWSTTDIVREIGAVVKKQHSNSDPIIQLLARLYRVVNNDKDAIPEGALGQRAIVALQWVLLHPDPMALLNDELVLLDPMSRAVATMLSGILNGFEIMPLELRPRMISEQVWTWQADRLKLNGQSETAQPRTTNVANAAIVEDERLDIARKNGWYDCIIFTIDGDSTDVNIGVQASKITIRVRGDAVVSTSIDAEQFERRSVGFANS